MATLALDAGHLTPAATLAEQSLGGAPPSKESPRGQFFPFEPKSGGEETKPGPQQSTMEHVMAQKLVVVESPAKAKTIEKYLGKDYKVLASVGHVRDLPESSLGVTVDNGFALEYVVNEDKHKVIDAITKAAKRAESVYLATDYDREGEAIAWHVAEAAGIPREKRNRVTFTEITRRAVTEAFDHPREIDSRLVDAQQARRAIDRLVGYPVSQLLWKKIRYGLSAGRVQSPAL